MYVKSNYITNAYGRLKYLFDEPAHDGSAHRVLGTNGSRVYLWGPRGQPYPAQSGYFINQQFKMVRRRAMNKRKRQQAQHLICSFSDREMPTDNPDNINVEVDQINQLVGGFMKQYFPQTQWVSAIQADGQEGHKLHCHILIRNNDTSFLSVKYSKRFSNEFPVEIDGTARLVKLFRVLES